MASEGARRGWSDVPIRDVVYFQEGPGLRNWQYRDAGIPFVNIRCLKDGRLLRSEMTCLDPEEVEAKYKHFLLDEGDYVVSSSGTLGRIAEVFHEDLPCMLNTSVIRFRPLDETRLDRRFLKAFLRSDLFSEQILAHANGSAQLNYGPTHLKQMAMPLPPISEQRSIGEILGSLDERIDNLRQTNATLEAIAQALFKSWFVDFDPVRAKAEGREPEGMDAATAALFPSEFEDSKLGPIPQGWRVESLVDVFEINPKRTMKKGSFAKYLDMASVPTTGHVPDAPIDRVFASGSKFTNGDTLLARITPCLENGKTAHVDFLDDHETAWGSTEFIVLRPRAPLPPYFGYLLARQNAFRTFAIQAMSGTSGRQRVEVGRLEQFRLSVPDPVVAIRFGEIVEPIRRTISANAKRAATLGSLRDTLLPRLISGKLRLPKAAAVTLEA